MGKFAPTTLLLLTLIACATPKERALEDAMDANQRRDQVAEARALQSACAIDPADAKICEQARSIGLLAARAGLATLDATCRTGNVDRCVAAVTNLRGLGVEPQEFQPFIEASREAMLERCRVMPLSTPEDALAHVRCAEQFRALIPTDTYDKECAVIRHDMGVWLEKWSTDRIPTLPAEAAAAAALADCFGTPTSGAAYRAWENLAAGWSRRRVQMTLRMQNGPPVSMCSALQPKLPAEWICGANDAPANSRLEVVLELGPTQHSERVTTREVTYVADVERVRNPNRAELKDEVRERNSDLQALKTEWEVANSDCAVTQSRRVCARAETLRLRYNELIDERDRVKRQQHREPEVLTREIRETYRYNERQHIWRRPVAMSTIFNRYDEWLELSGLERPGFAPAGIEALSASVPSERDWYALVDKRLDEFAEVFADRLKKDAQADALAGCSNAPNSLECGIRQRVVSQNEPITVAGIAVLGERLPEISSAWPRVACTPRR